MNTVSFTESPDRADFCSPGGYLITHVFQLQDDEEANTGQYTHVAQVEDWTEVSSVVDHMLTFPDGSGFTISITVTALHATNQTVRKDRTP